MKFLIVVLLALCATMINGKPFGKQEKAQALAKGNWCCAIDPAPVPVFSHTGQLIHYDPQPCPSQYLVCCKGHLNINGNCLDFNEISAVLPTWTALAQALGISINDAMGLIG